MSTLKVTLIDVGWGDSIFLESIDENEQHHYALIDSNDTSTLRSSHIFLKRHFEKKGISVPSPSRLFSWVMLSHIHADHGQGLQRILKDYGSENFWYPKSNSNPIFFSKLQRYSNRYSRVNEHQAIDNKMEPPDFGDVEINVLWPKEDQIDENENNNSIVISLTLGDVSFVLTGDAEIEVWNEIHNEIPANTRFFKVPHHGSSNGVFDGANTPWLDSLPPEAVLGISSHIRPFSHPSPEVVAKFDSKGREYYRTDKHYHLTYATDGADVKVKYSHYG